MNACIIAYSFYEDDYRVRRYAEALMEEGHSVDVIALRKKGEPTKTTLRDVKVYQIQDRNHEERTLNDYLVNILSFFLKGSFLLARKFRKSRYALVHIHNVPDFLIFMGAIPKLFGAKLILDIHDIMPEFFCQKFNRAMDCLLARVLLLVEYVSTGFSDHVIVANDLWRQKIVARDCKKKANCTTLLNYPNKAFFNAGGHRREHDGLRLIYPGTISHLHGIDILIRGLRIVKKEVPNVRLDIYTMVNNSDYFNWLRKLIIREGVNDCVHFHDHLPIEQLGKIVCDADIGIVCKREGIFASEAFSTKIFDYMAAGLPIIASRTKIDEYYFDDSFMMFFAPENYKQLAHAILSLYHDIAKRNALVAKGKQFLESNTWDSKKMDYLRLVNDLCPSASGPAKH